MTSADRSRQRSARDTSTRAAGPVTVTSTVRAAGTCSTMPGMAVRERTSSSLLRADASGSSTRIARSPQGSSLTGERRHGHASGLKAARTAAASPTAPGESPWTHNESASTATDSPLIAVTVPSVTMRTARSATKVGSARTAPAPTSAPASRPRHTLGRRSPHGRPVTRLRRRGTAPPTLAGRRGERCRGIRAHSPNDSCSLFLVVHDRVVERPVRLDTATRPPTERAMPSSAPSW